MRGSPSYKFPPPAISITSEPEDEYIAPVRGNVPTNQWWVAPVPSRPGMEFFPCLMHTIGSPAPLPVVTGPPRTIGIARPLNVVAAPQQSARLRAVDVVVSGQIYFPMEAVRTQALIPLYHVWAPERERTCHLFLVLDTQPPGVAPTLPGSYPMFDAFPYEALFEDTHYAGSIPIPDVAPSWRSTSGGRFRILASEHIVEPHDRVEVLTTDVVVPDTEWLAVLATKPRRIPFRFRLALDLLQSTTRDSYPFTYTLPSTGFDIWFLAYSDDPASSSSFEAAPPQIAVSGRVLYEYQAE